MNLCICFHFSVYRHYVASHLSIILHGPWDEKVAWNRDEWKIREAEEGGAAMETKTTTKFNK